MNAVVSFYRTFENRYGLDKQIISLITKLQTAPDSPALHVEPVKAAADPRVRTARVTDQYRAVLFDLHGSTERQFLLVDVLNHDEAYRFASTISLRSNAVTGITELLRDQPPAADAGGAAGKVLVSQEEIESRAKQLAAQKIAEYQAEQKAAAAAAAEAAETAEAEVVETKAERVPADILAAAGIAEQDLSDRLGLAPQTVELVLGAPSETAADELLATAPTWERDAVIGLLAGLSIEEVIDELSLDKPAAVDAARTEDDAIMAGMKTPAARMDFIYATDQKDLERVITGGSFDQWRVFLHPNQRKAVEADHAGSARVTGGAGTGKTVVVVHRTKRLLDKNPKARVLLTTYTRSLANSLKSLINTLDPKLPEASVHGAPGLWISGVDAVVGDVLHRARQDEIDAALEQALGIKSHFMPDGLDGRLESKLWREAADLKAGELPRKKANDVFLSQEYSTVILTQGIKDQKTYLRAPRPGRGTALKRNERKIIWDIIELFHAKCASHRRLTFAARAVVAATVLENREVPMFDHVLIDEAQDFHAGHWRFLRACVAPGPNDIFIAEDSHQRIYGQRLALAHYGIKTVGRASSKLRLNYRTTAQNLGYASAILEGTEWIDSESQADDLHGYRSARQGPAPEVIVSASKSEEAGGIAKRIKVWQAEADRGGRDDALSIGILTRTRQRTAEIETQLGELGIDVAATRHPTAEHQVSVMTMHNAKGLEFTHVILVDVSAEVLPQRYLLRGLAEAEREDTLQRERALLYVAASRARDRLVVSVVGEPSELLPRS